MRDFFSMEGPFNRYGGMLADIVLVSFMWLLFTLPVVSAGASTTALFYVTTRRLSEREGYITTDFWTSFKSNFKRATVVWLIYLTVTLLVLANIFIISNPENEGIQMRTFMFAAQLVILIITGLMSVYLYPLLARFDMKLIDIIKSAFFLTFRHFLTTLACVVMLGIAIFLFIQFLPLLIVLPGAYAWLASLLLMRVFRKYRPEMDRNVAEEIAEIEAAKDEKRRRGTNDSQNE
jgi:uncharacterized membrane protein YesL